MSTQPRDEPKAFDKARRDAGRSDARARVVADSVIRPALRAPAAPSAVAGIAASWFSIVTVVTLIVVFAAAAAAVAATYGPVFTQPGMGP
jgi:hypothetical protein